MTKPRSPYCLLPTASGMMPDMNDRPSFWTRLSSSVVVVNAWFSYRHDEVELPNARRTTYVYQEKAPAVVIVPVTTEGEVILVREYRYPVDAWCYGVPAGGIGDEDPEEAARRELKEEAGGSCRGLELVGTFFGMPGASDQRFYIYFASGVELGESDPEETEHLIVERVSIEDALMMARTGVVNDGPSALALLRCEAWLRGRTMADGP